MTDIAQVLLLILALSFITEHIILFALLWLIGRVVPLSLFEVMWRENLTLIATMLSDEEKETWAKDGSSDMPPESALNL